MIRTEVIDKLFLELSQVARATTAKELSLQRELSQFDIVRADSRSMPAIRRIADIIQDNRKLFGGQLGDNVFEKAAEYLETTIRHGT